MFIALEEQTSRSDRSAMALSVAAIDILLLRSKAAMEFLWQTSLNFSLRSVVIRLTIRPPGTRRRDGGSC